MVKFQLVSSLLFLGASCSSASQLNLASIQSKIRGSYSAGVIASRIKGELYLKGVCLNKYMDDPIVTTIIRDTLVNFEVLTESEANLVQPEHLLLTGRNQYKLKVVDGSSTAWSNIPWTDSLKKIFRWENRLEEHMGHFGPWWAHESETINAVINREYIYHPQHEVNVCKNIDALIRGLRNFFNYQTAENNFGMMLNLAWHYNSDDNVMSLQSAYIW